MSVQKVPVARPAPPFLRGLAKTPKAEFTRVNEYFGSELEAKFNTSEHTYNLLNNLLEWYRIQRDNIPFNPQKANLYYLVQEPFLLLNDWAKAKSIDIKIDVPEQLEIEADSEMIKTVIRNLLSNAIKFTHENGSIIVSVKAKPQNVEIEIADTGTGMDEATRKSLFKIVKSVSKPGTDNEEGTGFGLLLCKEFIDKHNGTILVKSKPGEGSTFIVTLPLNKVTNLGIVPK